MNQYIKSSPITPIAEYNNIYNVYDISPTVLGRGTFGSVRECTHRELGMKFAVKSIDKLKMTRQDAVRVKREVQILKAVDHPNVVQMVDFFEDEDYVHIVTEICTGGELFDLIVDSATGNGCLSEDQAILIVKTLLESVEYLHSKDIVHRDIKPENLLFSSSDEEVTSVKLIDFGLAFKHGINDRNMTEKVGTPHYISPEVLAGSYDRSCDIWAIGIVCYILLCGYFPFDGDTTDEILDSVYVGRFTFASPEWDYVSDEAKDFICSLLTRDPSKRSTIREALKSPWINGHDDFCIK